MRRRARVDDNHTEIVKALRKVGASVQSLATIGNGCPDILCAFRSRMYLFEIKDGRKPPSARKLTPDEKDWHLKWQAQVFVVSTVDEALRMIGEEKQYG